MRAGRPRSQGVGPWDMPSLTVTIARCSGQREPPVEPDAELGAWLQGDLAAVHLVLVQLPIEEAGSRADQGALQSAAPGEGADQEPGARAVGDELRLIFLLGRPGDQTTVIRPAHALVVQADRRAHDRDPLAIRQ